MVPLILGIAGGSGAGKTTVAQRIVKAIGPQLSLIISQDTYYRNWEDLPLKERGEHNFDHPAAFDNRLLAQHLQELKQGNSVPKLWYDYRVHTRRESGELLRPRDLIVRFGISQRFRTVGGSLKGVCPRAAKLSADLVGVSPTVAIPSLAM